MRELSGDDTQYAMSTFLPLTTLLFVANLKNSICRLLLSKLKSSRWSFLSRVRKGKEQEKEKIISREQKQGEASLRRGKSSWQRETAAWSKRAKTPFTAPNG